MSGLMRKLELPCEKCGGWKRPPARQARQFIGGGPCCCAVSASTAASALSTASAFSGSTEGLCVACEDSVHALRYQLTVTGVAAGTCPSGHCTPINRTWTLTNTTVCTFKDNLSVADCGGLANVSCTLILNSPTERIDLSFDGGFGRVTTYQKIFGSPFDCLISHSVDLLSAHAFCSGWPSSLTISPA